MKNKLSNNKGSTLLLLVIAIAVISILGTSVMAATMMNLKVKKTNTEIKETFYLSESGLDKAYDKANNLVMEAINKSDKKAQEFLQQFTLEKLNPSNPGHDSVKEYIDDDGINYSYNDIKIRDKAKSVFIDYFFNYVSVSNYDINHDNIVKSLKAIDSNPKVTIDKVSYNGINLSIDGFDNIYGAGLGIDEGGKLDIDIKSKGNLDDINKSTSITLSIEIPKYNAPYTISSSKFTTNNPFSDKALIVPTIQNPKKDKENDFDAFIKFYYKNLVIDPASYYESNYINSSTLKNIIEKEFIIIDGTSYNSNGSYKIFNNAKTERDITIVTNKKISIYINNSKSGTDSTLTISNNEIKLDIYGSVKFDGLMISSEDVYIKTTASEDVKFNGTIISAVKFESQTGSGDIIFKSSSETGNNDIWNDISDEIKDLIKDIYQHIYDESQDKMTIKSSGTATSVTDLIKMINWKNK